MENYKMPKSNRADTYKCEFLSLAALFSIKEDWEELQEGLDMTYFQSFNWYELLSRNANKDTKRSFVRLATVLKDGQVCLIAPLLIITKNFRFVNKKGCYIWESRWSDYLNVIYKDYDPNAFDCLCQEMKKVFNISNFYFNKLQESTSIYKDLSTRKTLAFDKAQICVRLELPSSFEDYWNSLGKKARQNIRTAKNRLIRNNLSFVVKNDDANVDKLNCKGLRECRVRSKNKKLGLLTRAKILIYSKLHVKEPTFLPLMEDEETHFLTSYINGSLASFFNYTKSSKRKEVYMMGVGIDEQYSWYSPGILSVIEFIQSCYETEKIRYIDFTRGDEKYKFIVGGKTHYIHSLSFTY